MDVISGKKLETPISSGDAWALLILLRLLLTSLSPLIKTTLRPNTWALLMTLNRLSTSTGTELTSLNQTTVTLITPMELMVLPFTLLLLSPTPSMEPHPKRPLPPLKTTSTPSVTSIILTESTTALRSLESSLVDTLVITTQMETLGNFYPLFLVSFSTTELAPCRLKSKTLAMTLPWVIPMKPTKHGRKFSTSEKTPLLLISWAHPWVLETQFWLESTPTWRTMVEESTNRLTKRLVSRCLPRLLLGLMLTSCTLFMSERLSSSKWRMGKPNKNSFNETRSN